MNENKAKILFFDLETMPNLVRTWRKWEQNVIWYERYGYIWSISYKFLNDKKVYHKNITEFPLYKKNKYSDESLVKFIWNLLNDCDIVVAHNGNAFDTKTITGRFIHYKLPPPSTYKKVDTKLLFKKYLNEDSNSLKDIAKKHNLPNKLETGGEILWEKCEKGDKKAIKKMKEYNNGDVITLEAAYKLILPYATEHPNIGMYSDKSEVCSKCGSTHLNGGGWVINKTTKYRRYHCMDCGSWCRSTKNEQKIKPLISV